MRSPIFIRPLTDAERQALTAGLRSPEAFVLRRCQILLASSRGERAPRIAEQLRALLHRPPRDFGYPADVWTPDRAAQLSVDQGLVATRVSGETIRQTLLRLGVGWKRAKHWITSPGPQYLRKKRSRQADRLDQPAARLGHWFPG